MELATIKYDSNDAIKEKSSFRIETKKYKNILYFFYKDEECLYIGETDVSLYDRCFVNTPKEKDQPWFNEGNKVLIVQLDAKDDESQTKCRHALEALFIVVNNPKYNKK